MFKGTLFATIELRKMENIQKQYPVMPLRNTVLFPQQVIPIYVGREKSLKLIEELDPENKHIVVVIKVCKRPNFR